MKNYIYFFFAVFLISSCARPIADFVVDHKDQTAPSKITFKNKSEKSESFDWDFGDGTGSTEKEPKHTYSLSGKYEITLIAKKGNKSDKKTKEIIVNSPENCLLEINTSMGKMLFELTDNTPLHRDNMIKLAEEGYYNDLLFHRIIKAFMIQGGDPKSRNADANTRLGSGGPGYTIDAELAAKNMHTKGALAAARQGDQVNPKKKSSGSQFYIVHGKPVGEEMLHRLEIQKGIEYTSEEKETYTNKGGTPFLDMEYTVFGYLVEGEDVLDRIAAVSTNPGDRPVDDVKIISVNIIK